MPNDFDASEYIDLFLAESREHLDAISSALVTAEADPGDSDAVDAIFRAAHSFKGMSATMGFDQLAALTHALEGMIEVLRSSTTKLPSEAIDTMFATLDLLGEMVAQIERDGATDADPAQLIAALAAHAKQQKKRPTIAARASVRPARPKTPDSPDDFVAAAVRANQQQSTVRVEAERLDHLLHMMGELVIRRSRVEQLVADTGVSELQAAVDDLTRVSQSVQEIVMRVRMIPIDTAFARIPRLVRDISHQLGKSVDLQLTGSETELDRTAVDALIEPLMHLVRNAVDHGIEPASERLAVGKPANGKVTISARHDGGEVVITVVDDGNGIDSAAIAETAVARGLISASDAEQLSEDAALEFLFQPGFSTAKRISNISGRGVGMDAVREAVRGFGGDVVLRTETGIGTTMQLRMPLTLAITPALVVTAGGVPYAVQLDRVERTYPVSAINFKTAVGQPVAVMDDRALTVVNLAERFGAPAGNPQFMVTVQSADRQLALTVDSLIGRRELVTRPVPPQIRADLPVSGGAVLASGEIALIIDCEALTRQPTAIQH